MMNLHLAAISADVAPGRHAVLLLDQAGWHLSDKLQVPDNITIVPLPPKCPELGHRPYGTARHRGSIGLLQPSKQSGNRERKRARIPLHRGGRGGRSGQLSI